MGGELGTWTPGSEGGGPEEPEGVGHGHASPWPAVEYPDELQCVDLTLLPNKVCAQAHTEKVTDVMMCVGRLEGGKDTCAVS